MLPSVGTPSRNDETVYNMNLVLDEDSAATYTCMVRTEIPNDLVMQSFNITGGCYYCRVYLCINITGGCYYCRVYQCINITGGCYYCRVYLCINITGGCYYYIAVCVYVLISQVGAIIAVCIYVLISQVGAIIAVCINVLISQVGAIIAVCIYVLISQVGAIIAVCIYVLISAVRTYNIVYWACNNCVLVLHPSGTPMANPIFPGVTDTTQSTSQVEDPVVRLGTSGYRGIHISFLTFFVLTVVFREVSLVCILLLVQKKLHFCTEQAI